MSGEYRIRRIASPDGKIVLFPLSDSQVLALKAIDEWVEAMRQISQKLNPPQPLANGGCCQQENLTEPSAKVSKEEDRQ